MTGLYLDNSATTPLSPAVLAAMHGAEEVFGNPSSLHTAGLFAEKLLSEARRSVKSALGATNGELVFCASGSEANNLALFGCAAAKESNRKKKILVSDSEHPSVLMPAKRLEEQGFEVIYIPTRRGILDSDAVEKASSDGRVFLASFMLVNNETGALYDVGGAFSEIRKNNPDALCHCDAVQGFLKTPFSPRSLGASAITVSGHKIHAPKGISALWISPGVIRKKQIVPIICGGGQENGFRSGTENVIGACGMGEACKSRLDTDGIAKTREKIISLLPTEVKINLPAGNYCPHIINMTLPRIKSETMVHFLSSKEIYISSGSACSSHGHGASRALTAFGLDEKSADCSVRVSLARPLSESEIDYFIASLTEGIKTLIRIR